MPQVRVNRSEYEKFCYLIKVMDAVDRAHALAKSYAHELRMSEGTQAIMDFNWNGVERHIQPQLQLVFLQDRHHRQGDQTFMRYPFACVVARNAQIVQLDSVFELDLEESDASAGAKTVSESLSALKSVAHTLGGKRMQDAERLINTLQRVLRTE